jgi:prolyl oligopeptidase
MRPAGSAHNATAVPPTARIDVVREERFGISLADPYRWMEAEDQELEGWLAGQGEHAAAVLGALPGRAALLARVTELTSAAAADFAFTPAGERMFFLRQPPGGGVPVLMMDDEILLDPSALTGAGHWNLDWFVPAPDGRHVACGLSQGGSEQSTLRVLEAGTGGLLPDAVAGAFLGAVSWLPEGDALVCHRYLDPEPGAPAHRRRQDSRACLHRLGTPADDDLVVLTRGLNPAVTLSPAERPLVFVSPGSDWMVAVIAHGTLTIPVGDDLADCSFYVAPRAALARPRTCPWRLVAGPSDGVVSYALDGDDMYLVTHRDAPRLRVDRVSLADFTAVTVVPAGERVAVAVRVAGDELLVHQRDAGLSRLRRVPLAGGKPADVPLPVNGVLDRWAVHPSRPEVFLTLSSRTSPPQVYRYSAGNLTDTDWLPSSPAGFGDLVTADLRVPARDGTLIPLRVSHRAGLTLDGTSPAILTGYGSFGVVLDGLFAPEMLAWYERGGIVADAGLRGGGEFGHEWHEAGRGPRKITTITDFIDCAEYLIAHGYTGARRLAGRGGSAGAVAVGGALVRRPDLFGAIVLEVPSVNKTRPAGAGSVGEFGDADTEDGLRDLLAIDCYQNVTEGTRYPAVLLTAGLNDPRVAVWHPAKMAARLQAATTSSRPVLLRVDPDAGHGHGSTPTQYDELTTDILAFLLHELT